MNSETRIPKAEITGIYGTLLKMMARKMLGRVPASSQNPPTVTDEMSAALLEAQRAPALVELTARIALMNSSARMNIALGIRSEELSAACGMQPLATAAADGVSAV